MEILTLKAFQKVAYLILLCVLFQGNLAQAQVLDNSIINTLIKKDPDAAFIKIKTSLNWSLKNNNSTSAAFCFQYFGELFYHQAAYSQAVKYYYKADHIFRKNKDLINLAGNLNKTGAAYYYSKQYDISLVKFQEALAIYKKLGNRKGIADSYGLVGQTFEKSTRYNEAMKYQRLALDVYKTVEDQTGIAKIYENLASIYEDKNRMDSALKYYSLALVLNKASANDIAQIEIINNIGDVYRKTGKYKKALAFTREAGRMALSMNDQYQLSSAYRDLSKNFDLMKKYDSAYHYSELGRNIFLKIFTEDNNKQMALLQTLFEIQQKDNAILQFENEKKVNQYIIVATVVILFLLILLAASIISRQRLKIRNEQKLNERNQALYEAQKNAMEADLELKSKELTTHTLHLIQKNQLLEQLKSKLNDVLKDDKRDQKKELKQIVNLISFNNNQDKNWNDFRIIFERVHENFFERLKKYNTALTSSELRLVALLKMNLGSADIATLLGISQDSLRISRYRLRKKLNLEEGENLSAFLQRL